MQSSKLGKILAAAIVLLLGLQSQCLAQSYGDAFSSQAAMGEIGGGNNTFSKTGAQTEQIQNGTAPILQGASCGTIGPQGGDATSIMGVNTAGALRKTPAEPFPVVPTFLVSMLSLSMLFFGLRSLVVQKRAPLWVVGSVAAGALLFVGFIWAALSEPTYSYFKFGFSNGETLEMDMFCS